MLQKKITKLFEQDVTSYLTLQRTEMDDATFMQLLRLKPGEINIILARTASFIRNDGKDKTRKDLINDILEVLERSAVARKFVGLGLQQEYNIFKGFPVRQGDPYDSMPGPGTNITLKPNDVYIGWSTDATTSREDAARYDEAKGDPIGGLLVNTHVDSTKILFDVNAVVRALQSKLQAINQYNSQAAPGKAISKANTDFLATQAPTYHGEWEVLTNNKVVNVKVEDKWTWDQSGGKKVVKWVNSSKPTTSLQQAVDATGETPVSQEKEVDQPDQAPIVPTPAQEKIQENLRVLFERAAVKENCSDCDKTSGQPSNLVIPEEHLDEAFKDHLKAVGNWISKTAAVTVRGKTMKYLSLLLKQYETQKNIYAAAKEYAAKIDKDPARVEYADRQMEIIDEYIEDARNALATLQVDSTHGLTFANPDDKSPENMENGEYDDDEDDDDEDMFANRDENGKIIDDDSIEGNSTRNEPAENQAVTSVRESLNSLFNESTLGIFDRIADAKVRVKDKVNRRILDKLMNRLIKNLDAHYNYRLKALQMQFELLQTDFNSYKGSRFESLPSVQKLAEMLDYTKENIRTVTKMKALFDKAKDKAVDFAFTGHTSPEENGEDGEQTDNQSQDGNQTAPDLLDKSTVVALDKQEDKIDQVQDTLVNKAVDAAKDASTVNPAQQPQAAEPEVEPELPEPEVVQPTKPVDATQQPQPVAPPEVVQPTPTAVQPADVAKAAAKKKVPISIKQRMDQAIKDKQPLRINGKLAPEQFKKDHPDWSEHKFAKFSKFYPPGVQAPASKIKQDQPIAQSTPPVEQTPPPSATANVKDPSVDPFAKLYTRDTFQNYMSNYEQKKLKTAEIEAAKQKLAKADAFMKPGAERALNRLNTELGQINTRLNIIPKDVADDQLEAALVAYKKWKAEREQMRLANNKPKEKVAEEIV